MKADLQTLYAFAMTQGQAKKLTIWLTIFLMGSPSFTNAQTQNSVNLAQQMFVSYYGRPGDPEGVNYWASQFDESTDLNKVLSSFGNSPEYYDNFGPLNHEQLVNGLFQQMFNRDSDPEGLAFYVGRLSSGRATLASIAKQIADGTLGSDDITFTNKVETAKTFTHLIEANGLSYDSDDITAARAVVSSVTFSEQSKNLGSELIEQWRSGITYYLINARKSCDLPTNAKYLKYHIDGTDYGWIAPGTGQWVKIASGVSSIVIEFGDSTPSETLSREIEKGGSLGWSCEAEKVHLSDYPIVNQSADIDHDGVNDESDAFPFDVSESRDSDQDGVGDNEDAYPQDPDRSTEDPDSTTEEPDSTNTGTSYSFTVSWDSTDLYSISDDDRYIATQYCYEAVYLDKATLTVTRDGDNAVASLGFSNGENCEVQYVLKPSTIDAASYDVVVSRESTDTYSTLNRGIYINTRFCVEFVYFDSAMLHIDNLSADAIGTLDFSDGNSCQVRSVLIDSLAEMLPASE